MFDYAFRFLRQFGEVEVNERIGAACTLGYRSERTKYTYTFSDELGYTETIVLVGGRLGIERHSDYGYRILWQGVPLRRYIPRFKKYGRSYSVKVDRSHVSVMRNRERGTKRTTMKCTGMWAYFGIRFNIVVDSPYVR